jgi:ribosomal protein S18 acetylase RimI-like enzyme
MEGKGWRRLKRQEAARGELFLRERERYCVSACSRFLNPDSSDRLWAYSAGNKISQGSGQPAALLLYSRRILFPVFGGCLDIPSPKFLRRFLILKPIHAIQGLTEETAILEETALSLGKEKKEQFDYDLMSLDGQPVAVSPRSAAPSLCVFTPRLGELDELFPLQAAYEKEEVIPRGGKFYAESSRFSLERIIKEGQILAARVEGKIVGKIHCNAQSFTRFQIGGVYVHPDYRGLGIATAMTLAMVESLFVYGKGITLFVKKRNAAARAVYKKAGFVYTADYRISYY